MNSSTPRGVSPGEGSAVAGHDLAAVEALQQAFGIEMEEALDHVGGHGRPGAGHRHVQTRRADAVAHRKRGEHAPSRQSLMRRS